MQPPASSTPNAVSNLIPSWDETDDGGGRAASPAEYAEVATVVERIARPAAPATPPRRITPPESYDVSTPLRRPTSFSHGLLADDEPTLAEAPELLPEVDYEALRRRDIARELLRARLVAIAEQREHRSAYEIAFILLAAAVAVLLAAPPLVQVLLAARGIEA